jgi:osmotically-inducible protein OsmY
VSSLKQVCASALAFTLAGVLCGCAVYGNCGFAGCPGDAKITAEVRALITQTPALMPPNLIHVETLDHVVYLTGQVNTDLTRSIADSVARAVAGVTRVVDSIGIDDVGG